MATNISVKAILDNSLPPLNISFGSTTVQKPGEHIPRLQAVTPPTISFTKPSSTGRYLLLSIDLDAPFSSFPILGPIMHLLQPNLTSSVTKDEAGFAVLARSKGEDSVGGVDWTPPRPPPGAGPHRYLFLLYEQPKDLDLGKLGWGNAKEVGLRARVRFDVDGFEEEAGLGKAVAGGWFVSN